MESWEVLFLIVGGIQWLLGNCEYCKGGVILGQAKSQYNELKSEHIFATLSVPSSSHIPFLSSKFDVS